MTITELMVKASKFSGLKLLTQVPAARRSGFGWTLRGANPQIPNRVQESLYRLASNFL